MLFRSRADALQDLKVSSRHGLITDVDITTSASDDAIATEIERFLHFRLPGDRYGTLARTQAAASSDVVREVVDWLREEM